MSLCAATFVVVRGTRWRAKTLEKLKFSCCLYLVKTFLCYDKQFKTSKVYLIYCQSQIDFCFIIKAHFINDLNRLFLTNTGTAQGSNCYLHNRDSHSIFISATDIVIWSCTIETLDLDCLFDDDA